ncbi:MAG: RNA-binding protein [Flavobacteriales bacterium]|nr:MAG: RNA-binding protein [Flavobacteriales bacterium]
MRNDNTQSLKDVLQQMMDTYRLTPKINEVKLIYSWEKVLGKTIAKHTTSLKIKNKKLIIKLDSSVLREELAYNKTKIIQLMNEEVGEVVIEDVLLK